jgi:glycosyltransferase involved in cell wall biosynthesis
MLLAARYAAGKLVILTSAQRTVAIIPAYNEAESIVGTLRELRSVRPDIDIVVIDDGSSDDTVGLARSVGVDVVSLPFNLGIGGALRTGFRWAIEHGYTRALQFDADGQHDPREIAVLLAPLDDGADMVVGSRFHQGEAGYPVGRLRQSAMGTLRVTLRILLKQSFTDTSSGFRAFNSPMLGYFASHYPAEYMESVEALYLACSEGFAVAEVPARMRLRSGGTPSNRHLRSVYHFARLYLVLMASAKRRRTPVVPSDGART